MQWWEIYFIWFIFYSVGGWVWEVVICGLLTKKFNNRGFLNGPYCPIYGVGALLVLTLLGKVESLLWLFLLGALLTCTLEYLTSWAMEKIFHTRWWDYCENFGNINGYVCVSSAVTFGLMSVLVVKLVHPKIAMYTQQLTEPLGGVMVGGLGLIILIDAVYTIMRLFEFERKLQALTEKAGVVVAGVRQRGKAMMKKGSEKYAKFYQTYKKINSQERRWIEAFPNLRSVRYNKTLQKIRRYILAESDRRKKGRERG